jgi:hypothetical protein
MAMTPEKRISYLRSEHQRTEYPVACCRKCHQNWPCDVIAGMDAAAAAERERLGALTMSERDLIHADLGGLLEACGLGNYARPESSHEVMQQAIAKVRGLRAPPLRFSEDGRPDCAECCEWMYGHHGGGVVTGVDPAQVTGVNVGAYHEGGHRDRAASEQEIRADERAQVYAEIRQLARGMGGAIEDFANALGGDDG